jgi:integrase
MASSVSAAVIFRECQTEQGTVQICAIPRMAKNLEPTAETSTAAGESLKPSQDVKGKIVQLLFQLQRDGRNPATIENYFKLFKATSKNRVNLIDPEDTKTFLARVKWKESTKANAVAMLDVWFKFLKLSWNPPDYEAVHEIYVPTEQQTDSLIAAAGKTLASYLQILKETGARCGEISKLAWTDMDFQQKTIRIRPEKGSLPRLLSLSTKALEMLNNLPKRREHPFVSAENMRSAFFIQRRRIAKLGISRLLRIHLHTLRHWRGTEEYHKTKDPFWVKEFLGHKNLQSTQVYIHIERARYQSGTTEDFYVKVAHTKEEITQLLESGFEYVLQKDGLAYFRKRK